jgi:hypothetical protein
MTKRKIFKEYTTTNLVDNLIVEQDGNQINIRTTCGRDGTLIFSKRQIKAIGEYLIKISK